MQNVLSISSTNIDNLCSVSNAVMLHTGT